MAVKFLTKIITIKFVLVIMIKTCSKRGLSMTKKKLDVRGLNCPIPVLRAHKALREALADDIFEVLTTDPGSLDDFPALCTSEGHRLLGVKTCEDYFQFTIQRKR